MLQTRLPHSDYIIETQTTTRVECFIQQQIAFGRYKKDKIVKEIHKEKIWEIQHVSQDQISQRDSERSEIT